MKISTTLVINPSLISNLHIETFSSLPTIILARAVADPSNTSKTGSLHLQRFGQIIEDEHSVAVVTILIMIKTKTDKVRKLPRIDPFYSSLSLVILINSSPALLARTQVRKDAQRYLNSLLCPTLSCLLCTGAYLREIYLFTVVLLIKQFL